MAPRDQPRILIVDDDPDVCEALRDLLESQHYIVQSVGNGQAALTLAADQRFDAVFLDVELPDENGLEVLRRLKETYSTLPIIILSGADANKAAALQNGAVAFFTKPYDRYELLSTLTRVILRP